MKKFILQKYPNLCIVLMHGQSVEHTQEITYGQPRRTSIELRRELKLCELRGYAGEVEIKTIVAEID